MLFQMHNLPILRELNRFTYMLCALLDTSTVKLIEKFTTEMGIHEYRCCWRRLRRRGPRQRPDHQRRKEGHPQEGRSRLHAGQELRAGGK